MSCMVLLLDFDKLLWFYSKTLLFTQIEALTTNLYTMSFDVTFLISKMYLPNLL